MLSAILDLAVRDKRIPANPANGVSLPRVNARRRRYLTADEVELLAAEAQRPPITRADSDLAEAYRAYATAVLVLAYCGLRWSELAALRTEHVDLVRRRLNISEGVTEIDGGTLSWGTPKSHEARSVPLPRFLADELDALLADRAGRDLVFTTVHGDVLRKPQRPSVLPPRRSASRAPPRTSCATPPPAWLLARARTSRPSSACSGTPAGR